MAVLDGAENEECLKLFLLLPLFQKLPVSQAAAVFCARNFIFTIPSRRH